MQTSYTQYQPKAVAGMIGDLRDNDIMSYSAESAVPIGMPLILGTNKERQCKLVGTGAGQAALVFGYSVLTSDIEQSSAGVVQYADKDTVPVMKEGRLWVMTQDAVVAGTAANLHLASGTVTDEAVAAGIEAFTQIIARFITGTTGADLAMIEITRKS